MVGRMLLVAALLASCGGAVADPQSADGSAEVADTFDATEVIGSCEAAPTGLTLTPLSVSGCLDADPTHEFQQVYVVNRYMPLSCKQDYPIDAVLTADPPDVGSISRYIFTVTHAALPRMPIDITITARLGGLMGTAQVHLSGLCK